MATLPSRADLVSSLTTEAAYQSALGDFYDFVSQLWVSGAPEDLTIALGSVTPTRAAITVDTESSTATDDLTNVVATNINNKTLIIRAKHAARKVVIKHLAGGSGQFFNNTAGDVELDNVTKVIMFSYNNTSNRWEEMYRNWGVFAPVTADKTAVKTALNIGTAADYDVGTSSGQIPFFSTSFFYYSFW